MQLGILFLNVGGQVLKEFPLTVHDIITILFWANYLLKHPHFINCITLQARVTKIMAALSQNRLLLVIVLHFADPTREV